MTLRCAFPCLIFTSFCFISFAATNDALERLVEADVARPVRPVGVDGQEEWNVRASLFMYPPTFAFAKVGGAVRYRFIATDGAGMRHAFENGEPTASLASIWKDVPVGWVLLTVTGLGADGRELGVAGTRRFWKKAPYRPGSYRPAKRPYAEAARKAYMNVLHSESVDMLARTGDIDRRYPHNCYPSKMLSRLILGMVELAGLEPACRDRAMRVAGNAADWMLAHTIRPPSPLAGFPVTYDSHPEAADVEPTAPARISREKADVSMNIYPADMALAYVALFAAGGNAKYLEAAKAVADRYLALQGKDGSWWLNQRISDGSALGSHRVMPVQGVIPMFEALALETGDARYSDAADRAFAYVENNPLRTWNWEGQFEDTPAAPKYQNLTKHDACSTAIYILGRFPGDKRRLAQARELLRFAEDQFVFWEKPYTPADEPVYIPEWNRPWAGKWECPSVAEQYSCYRPIDASASKLIQTYLALYRAEGNPLDLAKARTLGDEATRMQRDDGFIPTFWSDHPHVARDNWVNCMLYTASVLSELDSVPPSFGIGATAHVTWHEFDEREKTYEMMRAAGMDYVRSDFHFVRCRSKARGEAWNFDMYDRVVDDAKRHGIEVLPILMNPPEWGRDDFSRHEGEWSEFVRETVRHFKGRIPVYEVCNEPNLNSFWNNPKPESYLAALRTAYSSIKAEDPSAKVMVSGFSGVPLDFIERIYALGGKEFFDIMNVHPYTWPNPPNGMLEPMMAGLKNLMARYGDGGKPVWITEIGWPTHKARLPAKDLLLAGLRTARPDLKRWRIGYVDSFGDARRGKAYADAMAENLPAGSTAGSYTVAEINALVDADKLDAVVYPFDESFPLDTARHVVQFVKRGGTLVDFGGCPMWAPNRNGVIVAKTPEGKSVGGLMREQLRIDVVWPSPANGLAEHARTFVTDAAKKAGLKPDAGEFRCYRFFDRTKLEDGDEFIPLTTAKDKNGREVAGACVCRFKGVFKGALVLAGCGSDRGGATEADQERNLLHAMDIADSFGVERFFIYEFRAPEKDPHYSEDHFGIVHADFSPKRTYALLKGRFERKEGIGCQNLVLLRHSRMDIP